MTRRATIRAMTTLRSAILPIAACALLAACSTAASPTPDPTAAPVTPGPTESTAAATSTADGSVDPWQANAVEHRTHNGLEFEYDCPPGGEPDTIWGTDIYTDDSSVCTAGVHVGVITLEEGGTVTIGIRPGAAEYLGSERNGIESSTYAAWDGSFVVIPGD
jgi:hypothetical protein